MFCHSLAFRFIYNSTDASVLFWDNLLCGTTAGTLDVGCFYSSILRDQGGPHLFKVLQSLIPSVETILPNSKTIQQRCLSLCWIGWSHVPKVQIIPLSRVLILCNEGIAISTNVSQQTTVNGCRVAKSSSQVQWSEVARLVEANLVDTSFSWGIGLDVVLVKVLWLAPAWHCCSIS